MNRAEKLEELTRSIVVAHFIRMLNPKNKGFKSNFDYHTFNIVEHTIDLIKVLAPGRVLNILEKRDVSILAQKTWDYYIKIAGDGLPYCPHLHNK